MLGDVQPRVHFHRFWSSSSYHRSRFCFSLFKKHPPPRILLLLLLLNLPVVVVYVLLHFCFFFFFLLRLCCLFFLLLNQIRREGADNERPNRGRHGFDDRHSRVWFLLLLLVRLRRGKAPRFRRSPSLLLSAVVIFPCTSRIFARQKRIGRRRRRVRRRRRERKRTANDSSPLTTPSFQSGDFREERRKNKGASFHRSFRLPFFISFSFLCRLFL